MRRCFGDSVVSRLVLKISGCKCCRKKLKAHKLFVFRWKTGVQSFVEGFMARITTEEQVDVTVRPLTAAGNPAAIDGDVVWTSSDPAVATVTSTGPLTATVAAVGVGASQIVAKFDADLDVGELREIELSGAIEVVGAEAQTGEIVFGDPTIKPV
jgi:hypothetical protein